MKKKAEYKDRPRKRPKGVKDRGYLAIQIRLETGDMLFDFQDKLTERLGYKINKTDLFHIAIKRLVADDPI